MQIQRIAVCATLVLCLATLSGCKRNAKLTKANFDRINVGMTVADVEAILGPGELDPELNIGESSTVAGVVGVVGTLDSVSTGKSKFQVYKWGDDKRWIKVTFLQGKVAPANSKSAGGLD